MWEKVVSNAPILKSLEVLSMPMLHGASPRLAWREEVAVCPDARAIEQGSRLRAAP